MVFLLFFSNIHFDIWTSSKRVRYWCWPRLPRCVIICCIRSFLRTTKKYLFHVSILALKRRSRWRLIDAWLGTNLRHWQCWWLYGPRVGSVAWISERTCGWILKAPQRHDNVEKWWKHIVVPLGFRHLWHLCYTGWYLWVFTTRVHEVFFYGQCLGFELVLQLLGASSSGDQQVGISPTQQDWKVCNWCCTRKSMYESLPLILVTGIIVLVDAWKFWCIGAQNPRIFYTSPHHNNIKPQNDCLDGFPLQRGGFQDSMFLLLVIWAHGFFNQPSALVFQGRLHHKWSAPTHRMQNSWAPCGRMRCWQVCLSKTKTW